MIVYRVEELDGTGLYRNVDKLINHEIYEKLCGDNHPTPYNVEEWGTALNKLFEYGSFNQYIQYVFGFETKEQLIKWMFDAGEDVLNAVAKCKQYYIVEYGVSSSNVALGNHQCAFIKDKARLIYRHHFKEIFKFKSDIVS